MGSSSELRLLYLGRDWSLYQQVRQAIDRGLTSRPLEAAWELRRAGNQTEAQALVTGWTPHALFLEAGPQPNSRARFAESIHKRFPDLCLVAVTRTPEVRYRFPFHDTVVPPVQPGDLAPLWDRLLGTDVATQIVRGPFRLDLVERTVDGPAGHSVLSPKLCRLLQVLMERSGETVRRAELMQQVWETDFLKDTRTLDVHIRWLRERIEPEPSAPRYLQTVRGVGYRFTV